MQIELVSDEQGWEKLDSFWNELLEVGHVNFPFLRYEFQRAWWEFKGGGEWPRAKLFILLGYSDERELLGIAPFFRTEMGAQQVVRFIGSHEIADFLDLICRAEDLESFWEEIITFLTKAEEGSGLLLDLCNLLDSSATQAILKKVVKGDNLRVETETLQASPFIAVPDSMDDYMESLDSKHAHELRRKLRRAGKYPLPIELEIITGKDDYERAIDDFLRLMALEADKAAFLSEQMRKQMRSIALAGFENAWAQLAFLKVGDERAAAYLNFDYANRIWAYNAGFDPKFAELSPGWLLIAEMMQWCIDQQREAFDFMRGDEAYKYRFGGINRFVLQSTIKLS